MQRVYFESRLHKEACWKEYFDTPARNRFNNFVIVFGYECDGLFAPAYPYFLDTAGLPDVKVVGPVWVRLRYRGVNQHQDCATLDMMATGELNEYAVTVPAAHVRSEWDFMYLIEAMDTQGNACIYPDLEWETPYIVVKLDRR